MRFRRKAHASEARASLYQGWRPQREILDPPLFDCENGNSAIFIFTFEFPFKIFCCDINCFKAGVFLMLRKRK